jgi:transposase
MARRVRRKLTPALKAKVALEAIEGEKTMVERARQFDVHPAEIKRLKDQLLQGAAGFSDSDAAAKPETAIDLKDLHARIGQLALENDFCLARSRRWALASAKR